MEDYYDGESYSGYILDGMGALGLVGGGFLYTDGGARERGASYVAFGIGGAHLAAGVYISVASAMRKSSLGEQPVPTWAGRERARMAKVSRTFVVLQITEGVLIASGVTMGLVGHATDHPRVEGAGYALAAEAALTLLFDIVAARRACRYRAALRPYAMPGGAGVAVQF